jgi:hypothetical protein
LIFIIPRANGGAMALHSQRRPQGRYQGKAGCVLTQQDACALLGFFF